VIKKTLRTLLEEKEIKQLRLGGVVYLDGEVYTVRDRAHYRIIEFERAGKEIPVKKGSVIYHCGPLVRKGNDEWDIIAAGPTTSARMDEVAPKVIAKLGIRAIIGKGGMGISTREAMRRYGCVYLSITGGAAVLAATRIKAVKAVYWEDLGMAEAVWHLLVEDFGPLIVSIDARGNSLYDEVEEDARESVMKNGP
jgi:fumarate hydratase subunit beta